MTTETLGDKCFAVAPKLTRSLKTIVGPRKVPILQRNGTLHGKGNKSDFCAVCTKELEGKGKRGFV